MAGSGRIGNSAGTSGFTAASFRVPAHYFPLLVGAEAASRLGVSETDTQAMSSIRFLKLCLECMRASGDESYGVAARTVPKGTFGILMAAAAQGSDLDEALARFAEAAVLLRPDIKLGYKRNRRSLSIVLDYPGVRSARNELLMETFALSIHCGFRWLTDRPLQPVQVRLAEPVGSFQRSMLKGVFDCPDRRRGRGVTIAYRAADGTLPLAPVKYSTWAAHEFGAFMQILDEAAARRNARGATSDPAIICEVRHAIGDGAHCESEVASLLGMSPATLRRRLAEAGASFRTLLDAAQREIAATLLMTDKSLDDIASEIRYSDVRSFRRACRRWFGTTPVAYRQGRAPQ